MTQKFVLALVLVVFSGCTAATLSTGEKSQVDVVSAASFLGNEIYLDVIYPSLALNRGAPLDASSWKIDEAMSGLLQEKVKERGKEWRALNLDPAALQIAFGVRENRWKRTLGKYNQALLDLLFRAADSQGVHFLFLVYPIESLERFSTYRGPLGIHCSDPKAEHARAFVYFEFDYSLWDVGARKKIYQGTVNPHVTDELTFADCSNLLRDSILAQSLEGPVKKTMGLLVNKLFDTMEWPKPVQP